MKRIIYIIAVIFATAMTFSSCTAQKCPAYAHSQAEQSEPNS